MAPEWHSHMPKLSRWTGGGASMDVWTLEEQWYVSSCVAAFSQSQTSSIDIREHWEEVGAGPNFLLFFSFKFQGLFLTTDTWGHWVS